MKSEYNAPPNRERLETRLKELGQDVPDNATPQQLADIINAGLMDQAVASRALIDGKQRCLTFAAYWSALFGEKWKYIPHSQRGLMSEEQVRGVMK